MGIILSKRSVKIFINFTLLLFMFFCIPQGVLCYSKVPVSIVKVLKSEGTKKLNTLLLPININNASILWQYSQYSNFLTSEMPHQNRLWLVFFQKRLMLPHLPHSIFHPKINLLEGKSCWFFVKANFSSICLHKKCFLDECIQFRSAAGFRSNTNRTHRS